MTPTEQDEELREKIADVFDELCEPTNEFWHRDSGLHWAGKVMQLITADRKRVALEARIEPFDFVESCEPDCDDVRHAYHQGQWDMATRIKARQEEV